MSTKINVPIIALQDLTYSPNGFSVSNLKVGESAIVNFEVAKGLIAEGLAEQVFETKAAPRPENKAIQPEENKAKKTKNDNS